MVNFTEADVNSISNDAIALSFDDLRQECEAAVGELKGAHGWPDADLRVQSVHRLRNIVQSVLATYVFHRVIFPSENFWRAFFQAVPQQTAFQDHLRECDVLLRFAALQGVFSVCEADMRGIVWAIDPQACGGGTAEFHNVAEWLLKRAKSVASYRPLITVLRLVRNTMHHNGVYHPRKGGHQSVAFDGKTYEFRVGAPIDFVTWVFITEMTRHVLILLRTLAADAFIVKVPRVEVRN